MARIALPQLRAGNPTLDRALVMIQNAINDLDSRIPNGVLSESVVYALGDLQITDQPVVIARSVGVKVQLPRANALGTGIAEILVIVNQSTGNISLLAQGSDKVNGAASIALTTGQGAIVVGDGDSSLKAWVA